MNHKNSSNGINISRSNERRKIQFVPPKKFANSSFSSSVLIENHMKNGEKEVSAVRKREQGLFDAQLVRKNLKWTKINSIGPGFFNEGNTCFLNSTLQCLLYLPPFVQTLLSEGKHIFHRFKHSSDPREINGKNFPKPVLEIFASLVADVHQTHQKSKAISPRGMISCIRRVGKQFKVLRQEDAHEYLRQLLDCMHEEILKAHNLKVSDGKIAETTFISRVFGGYLCNTLTCPRCKFVSRTYNHFQDISLDLKIGINSVDSALKYFTQPEQLSKGNEWKCEKCHERVPVSNLYLCCLSLTLILGEKANDFQRSSECFSPPLKTLFIRELVWENYTTRSVSLGTNRNIYR